MRDGGLDKVAWIRGEQAVAVVSATAFFIAATYVFRRISGINFPKSFQRYAFSARK
jgi:hypothetical protein